MPVLDGFFSWAQEQGITAVWIILIGVLIFTVLKRSWMAGVIFIFGAAFAIAFMSDPTMVENIATEFMGLLGMR